MERAGYGKTFSARQNFDGLHFWDNRRTSPRMLTMAVQRAHHGPYRDEKLILVAPSHMHANILAA
jgi:hypothetical protein